MGIPTPMLSIYFRMEGFTGVSLNLDRTLSDFGSSIEAEEDAYRELVTQNPSRRDLCPTTHEVRGRIRPLTRQEQLITTVLSFLL